MLFVALLVMVFSLFCLFLRWFGIVFKNIIRCLSLIIFCVSLVFVFALCFLLFVIYLVCVCVFYMLFTKLNNIDFYYVQFSLMFLVCF